MTFPRCYNVLSLILSPGKNKTCKRIKPKPVTLCVREGFAVKKGAITAALLRGSYIR